MKKTMTMIVLSILMVLGMGIFRLNESALAAETNANTIQKLDINNDGVIDEVDTEIVKTSLKVGKNLYSTCDWVNVERAVKITETTKEHITEDIGDPIAGKQFTVRTKDTSDRLCGKIVHFTVRIEGEFTCEGVSYTKENPLEEDIRVKIGEDWVSEFITYNPRNESPTYTVTLVNLPVDAMVVDFKQSKDQPDVTTVLFSKMNSGKIKLEMNSKDDCVGRFKLKLTGEFEYKGKKLNEYEEVFKTSDVWESEEIYYTGESPKFVVEAIDNDQWIELSNASGEVDDDIVVTARKKVLAPPIAAGHLVIAAKGVDEIILGEEVQFIVKISGDFSYNGKNFTKDNPLQMAVKATIGKDDWVSGIIVYYGEVPTYEIEAVIPEGMTFLGASAAFNRDEIVTDMYSIKGKVGEETYCMFAFKAKNNFSEIEVSSQNTEVLEKLINSESLKVNNDNGIVFTNNEETFKFDSCKANHSGDIDYIGSFTAIDERGDVQFFEVGSRDGHYILSRGLSAPIACGRLVIASIGTDEILDGCLTKFTVTITGDFSYEGVSYDKEHPLVINVRNVIAEDWMSGDITYSGEVPTYEIAVDSIPDRVKIVNVYRNEESLLNENATTITGLVGERADCVFVFDSEENSCK